MTGICTACGLPATVRIIDNGIGVTEFWGCKSTHRDYCAETLCCDAPAEDEDGNPITIYDLEREQESESSYYL